AGGGGGRGGLVDGAAGVGLGVYFLPREAPERLDAAAVLVIDVLRSSTTVVAALEAGCRGVVPFVSVDDLRTAERGGRFGPTLTAGERGGLAIPGLDLGDSPPGFPRGRW